MGTGKPPPPQAVIVDTSRDPSLRVDALLCNSILSVDGFSHDLELASINLPKLHSIALASVAPTEPARTSLTTT